MTEPEARTALAAAMQDVAPEIDLDAVHPAVDLREQLDIDSMDFLNLVVALGERTGLEIPEADYPHLQTLDDAIEYLVERA